MVFGLIIEGDVMSFSDLGILYHQCKMFFFKLVWVLKYEVTIRVLTDFLEISVSTQHIESLKIQFLLNNP